MNSQSLEVSEALSAQGATAPRVSLQSMQAKILDVQCFNLYDALCAADGSLDVSPFNNFKPAKLMTIAVVVMKNGFVLIGKSAPASAENFDADKGKTFAYEDAIRQLWPLEGYALKEELSNPPLIKVDTTTGELSIVRQN